jgi:hypothetical protein
MAWSMAMTRCIRWCQRVTQGTDLFEINRRGPFTNVSFVDLRILSLTAWTAAEHLTDQFLLTYLRMSMSLAKVVLNTRLSSSFIILRSLDTLPCCNSSLRFAVG